MTEHGDAPDLFTAPAPTGDRVAEPGDSPGARLRAARELRGLTLANCSDRLHLPVKVLARLEDDDYGAPEHFVFVRGALRGYARFLGLPADACDDALRAAAPPAQPELVAVAHTSPLRWLLRRYGTAATYIVLTAFIAVPLVWLGLHGGLERPVPRTVSLDQAPTPTPPSRRAITSSVAPSARVPAASDNLPFRASLAPFAAIGLRDPDAPPAVRSPGTTHTAPAAGSHVLVVTASADCWYRITDGAGDEVDSGTLHAGDTRRWHSAGPLRVTLGNADGVRVTEDGRAVDLGPYRHANVARLDLFEAAPVGGESD